MKPKRRMKISTLLEKIFHKERCTTVIIKGHQTGAVLYEGRLMYVPYLLCMDYVFSYVHVPGRLEIVSTGSPYEDL